MCDQGKMVTGLAWPCGIGSCNVSMVQLGGWQLLAGGRPSSLPGTLGQPPQLVQGVTEGVLGLLVGCRHLAPGPLHCFTCHIYPNLHPRIGLMLLVSWLIAQP